MIETFKEAIKMIEKMDRAEIIKRLERLGYELSEPQKEDMSLTKLKDLFFIDTNDTGAIGQFVALNKK